MNEKRTALLVMDMQSAIVDRYPNSTATINNVAEAILNARKNKISIIYVVVGFRQGMPEVGANNKTFSASKERMVNADVNEMMKIHPSLTPYEHDIIVTKRRYSAFTGSDLELILRSQNINHLILTGIATSGVVLSTIREASDKDFVLTVLSDCCADGDEEVHHILTTKVFQMQAEVISLKQWIS
ncbi:isochorismatase family cysteine hydrolase [Flavobacterium ginsenosidimutans]|uniref:Isochorismatase family cysteine hydrolase n=1 Tax=Flavobacterium ginsenosidimutans TaxID=687844 RepID=A0ABZ2Q764_9FLAO